MKESGLPLMWIAAALVAAPLLVAPPLIRGLAAAEWVEHYASLESLPRPRRPAARALIEKMDSAMHNLAPLPQASAAAKRTLEIGQRLQNQVRDRETALLIYRGVRASCTRLRSRLFSGPGFAVIEARAAALENSAREAPGPPK